MKNRFYTSYQIWATMTKHEGKLNLFHVYIYYPGGLDNCHSLAKNNFVGDTFRKRGAVCGRVYQERGGFWKLLRNLCKRKKSREKWMYNESWLKNKTEKVWHLHCLCLHAITAVDNVFWNSLHFPSPCWS